MANPSSPKQGGMSINRKSVNHIIIYHHIPSYTIFWSPPNTFAVLLDVLRFPSGSPLPLSRRPSHRAWWTTPSLRNFNHFNLWIKITQNYQITQMNDIHSQQMPTKHFTMRNRIKFLDLFVSLWPIAMWAPQLWFPGCLWSTSVDRPTALHERRAGERPGCLGRCLGPLALRRCWCDANAWFPALV